MSYGVASRDYLKRAMLRIADGSLESLFYAAFELRCGIEARMQEYLDVWNHISKKTKSGWHIPTLGHNIEGVFRTGNRYVRVAVHDMESHNLIACFYHTPVTRQLRKQGEKLGDFVHAQRYRSPEDQWWDKLRTHLTQTGEALRLANTGTLLGPPMMRGTSVEMNSELPPGRDITSPMPEGLHCKFGISYPLSLPDPKEPEAVLWVWH